MTDQFDPFSLVAVIVISVALVKIFRPIVEAIAHRLRGPAVAPDAELMAEVDGLKDRLAEVEERLDFSERLLAQNHQPEPLPGRLQQ